jgi:hypothetical protein
VNDELVINEWEEATNPFLTTYQATVRLEGGLPVALRLEYADLDGFANVALQWTEPGDFQNLTIPGTQLYLPDQDLTALGIAMNGELPARRIGARSEWSSLP